MYALAFAAALLVDALTKGLVVRLLVPGQAAFALPVVLRLRHVQNSRLGACRTFVVSSWLAMMLGSLLVTHTPFGEIGLAQAGLGLAAGGATGNTVDRLRGGAVIDFVDIPRWPVFNFADVAIVGGVTLALLSVV